MPASIIVLRPAHFFAIDNDLIDHHAHTIGAIGVAVYAVLARYANRQTGACWPTIGRIAQTLGVARSTVKSYLRKLAQAGLIAISPRHDDAGDLSSNLYTLLDPTPDASTPGTDQAAAPQPVPEGGRPADTPPQAENRPRGRAPHDPKPSRIPEPKENNHPKHAHAAKPRPTHTPPPALPNLLVRPDDFLTGLDATTLADLESEARRLLMDEGVPESFVIRPVIESVMLRLWEHRQPASAVA